MAAPGTGWPGDPATPRTPVARDASGVVTLARGSRDVATLDARASVCRACPRLVGWREQVAATRRRAYAEEAYWGRPTVGFGDPAARLLVLGLAPAAHGSNRTGRVFTGDRSGDWIVAALHRAGFASQPTSVHAGDGLVLTGARMVPAVRCAPPDNAPTPVERDTCAPWLDRELDLLEHVRVILALGAFAWDAALAASRRRGWGVPVPRPKFGHGAHVPLPRSTVPGADVGGEGRDRHGAGGVGGGTEAVHLLASFHVSQQNTFTGRLTVPMLDEVLARAARLGAAPPVPFGEAERPPSRPAGSDPRD